MESQGFFQVRLHRLDHALADSLHGRNRSVLDGTSYLPTENKDGREIYIGTDALLFATAKGPFPPFLTGNHGYHTAPFNVFLATSTPGATIR